MISQETLIYAVMGLLGIISLVAVYMAITEKDLVKAVLYSAIQSTAYAFLFYLLMAPDIVLVYVPVAVAEDQFKKITLAALELDGLVVGLGGRDENRISAGNFGLPLNGSEYDREHTPVNAPLFNAAIDMNKDDFVGKKALQKDIDSGTNKRMVLFISEGIVTGRAIFKDGKKIGTVTSSINSPNVSQEKREYIGSLRKNVSGEDGIAAIGLGWLKHNPFKIDENGKDILIIDDKAVRIPIEFFRIDDEGNLKGKPVRGYISGDGVTPATAPRALKNIQNL